MLKNKKAMSISIVLLVLATLVLTIFTLYVFYSKEKKIEEQIYIIKFLEDIYSKEEIINFYISEILEKSVRDTGSDENKIIENFKLGLENYKVNNNFIVPELAQIEKQINENPDLFVIENGKVTAEFQITLEDKVIVKEKELFSAVYTYKKKFEKTLA